MAKHPSDYTDFPSEIILKPLPLVGFSGLDTVNNAIHRAVWDAFSDERRAERAAVRFRLLSNTLEFPVVKPERTSYEWYVPRGLLKRNWIHKRVELVPALVVVFYDMEWDDPQWNERIIECASRVRSVRAALAGHDTRVAVAVLQRAPCPPAEREAERAQELCAACDLQPRSLFLLPHGDRLPGYVLRLEAAFLEIARAYYLHRAKAVKQHRERLDKNNHRYLYVRHQFKQGFLHEMRADPGAAHKHYLQAYSDLLEVRMSDENVHEIRTVAGYINYKLCRLLFTLNLPRDAIAQLKTHIERYENRTGPADLLFEHYAWLARQHSAFAELFDDAIRAGLPAVRSQHPGFYYRQAAHCTVRRRRAMVTVRTETDEAPPDSSDALDSGDHYGQRSWRPDKERAYRGALLYRERRVDHSTMIVSFLGSAISQFKTFHSPRTRKRLVVEMADEYYHAGAYGKALTLLVHMLWDYRRERWWTLASHVLVRALRCAYLAVETGDYLRLAVEALSDRIRLTDDERDRIFANIVRVLDGEAPGPEPDVPAASLEAAAEAWCAFVRREPRDAFVDMTDISSFIKIKPKFNKNKYEVDEEVNVELFIRSSYGKKITFKKASVTLSVDGETAEISARDPLLADGSEVTLETGSVRTMRATHRPPARLAGCRLRVDAVSLSLHNNEKKMKIYLNFKFDDAPKTDSSFRPELIDFIPSPGGDRAFDDIIVRTIARISPREREPVVTFHNEGPALRGEWFPTVLRVTNRDRQDARDVRVALALRPAPDGSDSGVALRIDPEAAPAATATLSIGTLRPSASVSHTFYIKSDRADAATVRAVVSRETDAPGAAGRGEFVTDTVFVDPFEVSADFAGFDLRPISNCRVGDPFVATPRIKVVGPWPLVIEDTRLDVADGYALEEGSGARRGPGRRAAGPGRRVADALCARATRAERDPPPGLGVYSVTWRRAGAGAGAGAGAECCGPVSSGATLPGLPSWECAVRVRGRFPGVVRVREPLEVSCEVTAGAGAGAGPVRVRVTAEGTEWFMFAGYKSVSAWVTPGAPRVFRFRLYPLAVGRAVPPRLEVSVDPLGAARGVQETFREALPGHVFVLPAEWDDK